MANHRFQVNLHSTSNMAEDDVENVLYFETNAPDTVEGTCDGIIGAYQNLNGLLSGTLTGGATIKVYDLAGGQPVFQKEYPAATLTTDGNSSPREVACCLSYATVDDVNASTPRRRGRIYLGPWQSIATDRPEAFRIAKILDMGEELASVGTAGNTTWLMYSKTDNVTAKIESIWCDNAWDTQRRRGSAPNHKTVRDVQ